MLIYENSHNYLCKELTNSGVYDRRQHSPEVVDYLSKLIIAKASNLNWAGSYVDYDALLLQQKDCSLLDRKELGDNCLLQISFFHELLTSRGVDISHYAISGIKSYESCQVMECHLIAANYSDYVLMLRSCKKMDFGQWF